MSSPSYLEEPQVAYLSRIIQDVRNGSILIPRFQRRFVWSIDDRLKLLESLRDGIPIGSFLVWRTSNHSLDTFPTIGGIRVPQGPPETPGAARQYLLDGHQRLSTLFSALATSIPDSESNTNEADPDFEAGDIIYDLRSEEFVTTSKKTKKSACHLPLNKLLDSIELLKFQRNLVEENDSDILIARADILANRFRNYKIPIIPIVTDDLEAATRAFERINSTGVRMGDYHMVAALTYSQDFSLSDKLDEANERLARISWGSLDEKYILAVIRSNEGLEISSPNALSTSKFIKDHPEAISNAVDSIIKAASFLRDHCLIPSPDFVPYSYQFVFLSYAFLNQNYDAGSKLELLKRWLWKTTYTGFFRGARESDLGDARRQIDRILERDEEPFTDDPRGSFIVRPERGRFDFRSARSRAIVNRLADIQISNNEHNRPEILETMAELGSKCLMTMVSGKEYQGTDAKGFENRFLIPFNDGLAIQGNLTTAYLLNDSVAMASHAVDHSAMLSLLDNDIAGFFAHRRHLILQKEAEFVRSMGLQYQITDANS